ncbi:right-handed parallel beta-helix repeat-containing protein [Candidatus Acetothermia bacterium]|jgi:hypothetical protein|nr:right-handed parallel beta-helix repeat-containing protein [Candidatus Acetothermia bacterium]MCI2432101.1 right-handed parallel beta-helix repeat-containing protein [Candidatus Acetothermia bacterium]MCI2435908.1 right-handed parallel beta-helix repeat-containing protein [Candidatus Acetothermia bacterium]
MKTKVVFLLLLGCWPLLSISPKQISGYTVCKQGCLYQSIQVAIDAAVEGTTITIGPGLYKENIQIDKSLRLVGAGQEHVQIRAADEKKPIVYVLSETPKQIYFQGFTVGDPSLPLLDLPSTAPTGAAFPPPHTGLIAVGPIQLMLQDFAVGGQQGGGIIVMPFPSMDDRTLFFARPHVILERVHLVRNLVGLIATGVEVLVRHSRILENISGLRGTSMTLIKNEIKENRSAGIQLLASDYNPDHLGLILENDVSKNAIGIFLAMPGLEERGYIAENFVDIRGNRFVQNREYAIMVFDPRCPTPIGWPFLSQSGGIRVMGAGNEFQSNVKGDLCPPDYPWPPGFRK